MGWGKLDHANHELWHNASSQIKRTGLKKWNHCLFSIRHNCFVYQIFRAQAKNTAAECLLRKEPNHFFRHQFVCCPPLLYQREQYVLVEPFSKFTFSSVWSAAGKISNRRVNMAAHLLTETADACSDADHAFVLSLRSSLFNWVKGWVLIYFEWLTIKEDPLRILWHWHWNHIEGVIQASDFDDEIQKLWSTMTYLEFEIAYEGTLVKTQCQIL